MKKELKLNIQGMTCSHCATSIEKLLLKSKGVKGAKVSYPEGECVCTYDADEISKQEILDTITK